MPRGGAVIRYTGPRGTVWRIKYADASGRQIMETLGPEAEGWTRRKAEAELRERLVRVERKAWRRPAPLTFAEYADVWFEEGQSRRRWKPQTVKAYRFVVARLVEHLGPMPLEAIRPRHVAEYVSTLSCTHGASIVNRDLSLLHAILRTAQREELVEANAAAGAERPRLPRRTWRILEPTEVARVAREFRDPRHRVAFFTLVLTGVRRHELLDLRWADVDLIEGVLRIADAKTEEGVRSIAIPPMLCEELWQHRRRSVYDSDGDRVFAHPETGGALRADAFRDAFHEALRAAGIDGYVRPFHDLRHTAITNDAAAGSSPIAVMAKAGHRSMATTKTYLHLAGVVFRDEAARLEQRFFGHGEVRSTADSESDLHQ